MMIMGLLRRSKRLENLQKNSIVRLKIHTSKRMKSMVLVDSEGDIFIADDSNIRSFHWRTKTSKRVILLASVPRLWYLMVGYIYLCKTKRVILQSYNSSPPGTRLVSLSSSASFLFHRRTLKLQCLCVSVPFEILLCTKSTACWWVRIHCCYKEVQQQYYVQIRC